MVDGEDDEDDVGVVVRERTQTVKVLLSGRVPECEFHELAVELDLSDEVLEDGWDVVLRKEKGRREGELEFRGQERVLSQPGDQKPRDDGRETENVRAKILSTKKGCEEAQGAPGRRGGDLASSRASPSSTLSLRSPFELTELNRSSESTSEPLLSSSAAFKPILVSLNALARHRSSQAGPSSLLPQSTHPTHDGTIPMETHDRETIVRVPASPKRSERKRERGQPEPSSLR